MITSDGKVASSVPMTDVEDVKQLAHFDHVVGFEDEVGGLPIEEADRIAEKVMAQVHQGTDLGYCVIHVDPYANKGVAAPNEQISEVKTE